MKVEYAWKDGSRFRVKAEIAGPPIKALRERHGDKLTPQHVVDEARKKSHPLHPLFDWDDTRAAEKYRKVQARHIIARIQIVMVGDDDSRSQMIQHVRVQTPEGSYYTSTRNAMTTPDLRALVLAEAITYLNSAKRRYEHLEELQGVFAEVEKVERKNAAKARRKQPQPALAGA